MLFEQRLAESYPWIEKFIAESKKFSSRLSSYETVFDLAQNLDKITKIEARMSEAGFWDDQETAQQQVGDLKSLKSIVTPLVETLKSAEDLTAMVEMAEEDESFEAEVVSEVERLQKEIECFN